MNMGVVHPSPAKTQRVNGTGLMGRWSRRHFLALLVTAVLRPRALFAQPRTSLDEGTHKIVGTVCDRFLPAQGSNPGARALGIDRELVQRFGQSRRGRLTLELIARELRAKDFPGMSPAQQEALLRDYLGGRIDSPAAPSFSPLRDLVVQLYYARPQAWKALDYRNPQPDGYPGYATCRAPDAAG
jgi:hypothetical protein